MTTRRSRPSLVEWFVLKIMAFVLKLHGQVVFSDRGRRRTTGGDPTRTCRYNQLQAAWHGQPEPPCNDGQCQDHHG